MRLSYTVGDTAHWRVINASVAIHPMHLHGAYFRVDSAGDGEREAISSPEQQRLAVTELMQPGRTTLGSWTPTHAGNWIFHCHLAVHFDPALAREAADLPHLTLTLSQNPHPPNSTRRCINVELRDGAVVPATRHGSELGPPIVLYRGQPTEITVNNLESFTAIHWHGIELESYYNGVPGYGGDSRQVTPPIARGESTRS